MSADDMFRPLDAEAAAPAPEAAPAADEWRAIMPASEPLPAVIRHRKHGTPSHVWEYRDARGALLHLVARFDLPGGRKEILPLTCGPDGWRWCGPRAPRPLFGLDVLAARPDAPVLIVEGEKATRAAAALFADDVPITWSGGAAAVAQADWTPLRGRRVIVWPDADDAGRRAAAEVAKRARRRRRERFNRARARGLAAGLGPGRRGARRRAARHVARHARRCRSRGRRAARRRARRRRRRSAAARLPADGRRLVLR
jgi:hypothetical protein